ncbi:MAG TPA: hypothetical protein VNT42_11955, partial [Sphingomonas sp.]|nr:hypothetical protein [Sphingomonas sp.]
AMAMTTRVNGEGVLQGGYFDEWDKRPVAAYGPNPFLAGPLFMEGRAFCAKYMTPWNVIPNASGALFRRSALEAIGGPVTDMKICGDWFTYCKMLMHSDFASVPDRLSYFRNHTSNVRRRTRAADFIRESLEVREFLEHALGTRPSARAERNARDFYAQMLVGAERTGPRNKTPLPRYPAVLSEARQLRAGLTAPVLRILASEAAASLVRRARAA